MYADNVGKCGWFGKNLYFKGLVWTGPLVMRNQRMDEIVKFSEDDFKIVNNRKGVRYFREPKRGVCIPFNKVKIEGLIYTLEIPNRDFDEAVVDLMQRARKETADWKDKLLVYGLVALTVMFCLISLILIIQMTNNAQEKASKLVLDAGGLCLESAKQICSDICSKQIATAP